ncbi:MAG: hypothetical protein QM426_00550 [Euryarchaeota archaeon]|nr:hypothetical protein [Euryarchaeota archaeon]
MQKKQETKRTDEAEREFIKAEKRETARRIEETIYSERDEIRELMTVLIMAEDESYNSTIIII